MTTAVHTGMKPQHDLERALAHDDHLDLRFARRAAAHAPDDGSQCRIRSNQKITSAASIGFLAISMEEDYVYNEH